MTELVRGDMIVAMIFGIGLPAYAIILVLIFRWFEKREIKKGRGGWDV